MPLIRKDAQAGGAQPVASALSQLKSDSSEERWSAARSLGKSAEDVAALSAALAVESVPRVREALLTALARIGTADAVQAILPLLRSKDAAIRTGALDALNAMPGAVEAHLPKLLADPDPDVRLLVCDTLRRLPGPVASRYLCELLNQEMVPNVCAAAIEVLSEVGDSQALPVLARCAARFADEPFLVFSIRIAAERIGGDQGRPGSR